jgi:hypothetical protein
MRRLVPVVLVVALAGCGGGKSAETTAPTTTRATTTASADPGKDAVDAFLAAAAAGRTEAIWGMLPTASKERLGPTLGEFKSGAGGELGDTIGSFRNVKVIVSERITDEFGVVAIDGRQNGKRAVYAVPLRLEGARWELELGSPVKVRPIGPLPGAREPVVAQIAAAVTGPGGSGSAVMYLDGHTENPKVAGTSSNATLYANFVPALDPGRHTVVVFASDGGEAGATAWSFIAEKTSG